MTAMPASAKWNAALAAMVPTTATSGSGRSRCDALAEQNAAGHQHGQRQRREAGAFQALQELPRLTERAVRGDRDAEHVRQHGDADLAADAGEKPDQHGARQEVGQEPQLEDPRQQQQPGGEQRDHADQRDVLRAAGRRHGGQRAEQDGCGGGVGRHDQVAGRPEDRECDERQQHGVEAGDDGHPGDAGVAEHLRDVHRREDHARQRVACHAAGCDGPKAREERQVEVALSQYCRPLGHAWAGPGHPFRHCAARGVGDKPWHDVGAGRRGGTTREATSPTICDRPLRRCVA